MVYLCTEFLFSDNKIKTSEVYLFYSRYIFNKPDPPLPSQQALADTARPDTPPQSPMQVVGQFLNHLLQDHTLPRRCSAKDNLGSLPRHHRSVTSYQYIAQPLYYCPVLTYSQMDFLCLILNVFSGIPESYQVLRCQATTTEEELSLFLKRVEQYHAHYLMLDVNKLPFKLQEVREGGRGWREGGKGVKEGGRD